MYRETDRVHGGNACPVFDFCRFDLLGGQLVICELIPTKHFACCRAQY